jgi:RNA polymerase sigma-70 factor (ECF subfamily)
MRGRAVAGGMTAALGSPVEGVDRVHEDRRTDAAPTDEADLVTRLRNGDEAAFQSIVARYHGTMIAVARSHVKSNDVAEEVVQEAWLGVLNGLDRFEGRSSLKTWILRILVNTALTRSGREARSIPFSSLVPADEEEPAVEPERFNPSGAAYPGHWTAYPRDWRRLPADSLLRRETLGVVKRAIEELPDAQRTVITMRDVAGFTAEEVREALDVSDSNQRVLLHRARSRVRAVLERYLDG